MKGNKQDKRWIEQLPESEQLSDDAVRRIVSQDKDRFLQAKQRAMQAIEDETVVPVGGISPGRLGWLAVGVAALACIIFFSVSENNFAVPHLIATPAVAGYLGGIEGEVISNHDLEPVCGVEVYEQAVGKSGYGRLVGITDAKGLFSVPPSDTTEAVELTFLFNGIEVGQIVMDQDLHDSMGYERVQVDLHRDKTTISADVVLNPGQSKEVLGSVHLALSQDASQPWSGTVVLDRNWPGHFAYSQCLEGLLRIEGPETEYLEVTLDIGLDKLELFQTDASDLKVITYSNEYRKQQKNDDETWWRAAAHNGWYDIADDYLLGLDQAASGVRYQVPRTKETGESASVSWNPSVGSKYALLAPVQNDGRIVACWFSCYRGDEHNWYPTIKLIERTKQVSTLFEYRYYPEDEDGYYTDPAMLNRNESDFSFYASEMSRNHAPSSEGLEPFLNDDDDAEFDEKYAKLPGEFQLVRYDFSLSNPVFYPLIEADFSNPPGNYVVEIDRNALGENTTLKLTGDLDRLAKPPRWDFYGDYIWESNGYSADFRPTRAGRVAYKVILEEKCGNVVILERELHFPFPWAIGYFQQERDLPVVYGKLEQPKEASSLTTYSEHAVSSPAAYGFTTGYSAGPRLCIDPPDAFRNVPLKEMTVHLYARGVAGDYRDMPLNVHVFSVKTLEGMDEFGLLQFRSNKEFSDYTIGTKDSKLDLCGRGWQSRKFSRALRDPETTKTATEMLKSLNTEHAESAQFIYQSMLGLDILNLPPEEVCVEKLLAFADHPYMCINFAIDEVTDIVSRTELHGGVLGAGDYILIRVKMEDMGLPVAGQWELYSGGDTLSRVEIEAVDGRKFTTYFDYAPVVE